MHIALGSRAARRREAAERVAELGDPYTRRLIESVPRLSRAARLR
ncbi:hypothetical protein [Nonomuraea sp. B19D2]